jgi:hypothetical protein
MKYVLKEEGRAQPRDRAKRAKREIFSQFEDRREELAARIGEKEESEMNFYEYRSTWSL